LPHGVAISLTNKSDIVLLFAETDEELNKRCPPGAPCRLAFQWGRADPVDAHRRNIRSI
jgi:hypothetical protein